MNSDSFIHKELLRIYPEYGAISDPTLQLDFFTALPLTTRRVLKAASVRAKGVGPNRLLINDPQIDTQALCAPGTSTLSSCLTDQPTLFTLISAYVAYYPFTAEEDMPAGQTHSVLDSQVIAAYRAWRRDVTSSSYISLPGQTMELVGFLSAECLDDDLCVVEVVDLYYLLLRRSESYAKHLFRARFPLTHEIDTPSIGSAEGYLNEPTQVLLSNVPLFADQTCRKHADLTAILEQFVQLRKQFRLWLLAGLHYQVLTLLDSNCTGSASNTEVSISSLLILDEPFLPQDASDDVYEPNENKNRLLVLKDKAAATSMLLNTPCISDLQNSQEKKGLEVLQSLQNHLMRYVDKEFDALCEAHIPLFPKGWA